ncbi:hypothetical protein EYF80_025872 [Liparis tanakae]|uniref:Uncharacterized protein n=1 Tax=Liparis tanakae TaxID=230148 RepID=A0A4Z2HDL0_9TELE|nr:hypothetical protein EYF80_025872 [Liparis tanakae]
MVRRRRGEEEGQIESCPQGYMEEMANEGGGGGACPSHGGGSGGPLQPGRTLRQSQCHCDTHTVYTSLSFFHKSDDAARKEGAKQVSHGEKGARAGREMERQRERRRERERKLVVSNTAGIINQISHNPLRRGPSLGLAWTRSAGRGASIGVATAMLTAPGSEVERGKGVSPSSRPGFTVFCSRRVLGLTSLRSEEKSYSLRSPWLDLLMDTIVGGKLPGNWVLEEDKDHPGEKMRYKGGGREQAGFIHPSPADGAQRGPLTGGQSRIPLLGKAHHVLLQLLHLAQQRALLGLQHVPLLDAFEAAGLRVAPVLQGAPLLLQADHLLLAEAPQLPVQLPHRHADQLIVREAVLQAGVVAVVVVMVMVALVVVARRGRGQVLPDVLLPAEAIVGLVVVVVVVRVADEGLHRVLRACLCSLLLLTTYARFKCTLKYQEPPGRLKLEPGEFGDANLSCPRFTSAAHLPPCD